MTRASNPETASSGPWSFSLAFYERPGVAAALIALQDGANLDVNLILFAIWLGLSGRGRVDERRMEGADQAIHAIRLDVIEPLRALRRRLKPSGDADIQGLREMIKTLEIDAEKAAQKRLALLAGPVSTAHRAERLADAEANLALYLGPAAAQGSAAAVIRGQLKLFAQDALSPARAVRPTV
jgi:uncharacterized protein (TIGR02444 family)